MNRALLLLATLLASALPSAQAQELKASSRLFAREKGEEIQIAIEVRLEAGFHLYHGPAPSDAGDADAGGLPTTVEFDAAGFEIGALEYPAPEKVPVTIGTDHYVSYEHEGTFVLRAKGKRTSPGAKLEGIGATIKGLTCDAKGCTQYEQELAFQGAGSDELFASAAPQKQEEFALWAFLLSAVGWGLFTLLMPCTYPMIPITISYFTKQASQRQGSTLPLSLAYGVGIIGTFVLIGLVVGPPIVAFASHPVTNLVIGVLFLYFSLTLFGAVNLQPPAFLLAVAGRASSKGGLIGVFLMGATLVVTSFTCTAPFVGTLLSTGASSGGLGRVALGMAVFGATMAVPFVALSMLPGKAKAMPRSGEWMHTLKVTLGFVEVAAALKFISNADLVWQWGWLSRELFLFLWVGIFLVAALYLFGLIRLRDEGTSEIAPGRMIAGLVFLLFSAYCGYGALGNRLDPLMTAIIPPYSNRTEASSLGRAQPKRPIVIDDYDKALALAREQNKLLFVNFTGHV
jgi:thiol:disulfide interchange protein DsbD